MSGCSREPTTGAIEIPSFEELLEINSIESVLAEHTNVYVSAVSKSDQPNYDYTEEYIYIKGGKTFDYHQRWKESTDTSYHYTSSVGNAVYYLDAEETLAMLDESEEKFIDYAPDFTSTPIGRGYIENNQIVYHSYAIYESDDIFEASRYDYTLYFNVDTKLLEKLTYVYYDENHAVCAEFSADVSYDVENIESKLDTTAYELVMTSDRMIELEIITDYNTPEQVSHPFIATTDAEVWFISGYEIYGLYTDPEYRNEVLTLDGAAGEEKLTLYAKLLEEAE